MERYKYKTTNLTEEDFVSGFGLNTSHYVKVLNARGYTFNSKNNSYDTRDGCDITGKPFNKRHHKYHDYYMIEKETNRKLIIDCVVIQNYYGQYIDVLYREEGTNSHGSVTIENISSIHPSIVEEANNFSNHYELIKTK